MSRKLYLELEHLFEELYVDLEDNLPGIDPDATLGVSQQDATVAVIHCSNPELVLDDLIGDCIIDPVETDYRIE